MNATLSTLTPLPLPVIAPAENHSQKDHFEVHPLPDFIDHYSIMLSVDQRIDTYEIIYIEKGSGILTVNLKEYEIKDGLVYLLWPGQLRSLKSATSMKGYYLSLATDFFHLMGIDPHFGFLSSRLSNAYVPITMNIDGNAQQDLEDILLIMRKEYTHYFSLRTEIIKGLLKIFLLYLSRKAAITHHGDNMRMNDRNLVTKFMTLLSKNFATKKMVADYASELCVTRSYLNQVVKKVTGNTASQYIQQHIVLEAKRKAMQTSCSMKEIAYELGFDDIAHFSKFFKNNCGMNFTCFKRMMSKPDAVF